MIALATALALAFSDVYARPLTHRADEVPAAATQAQIDAVFVIVHFNEAGAPDSGATAFLLDTTKYGPVLVTNEHVCSPQKAPSGKAAAPGSFIVIQEGATYETRAIESNSTLDICILEASKWLLAGRTPLKLAKKAPDVGGGVVTIGFPSARYPLQVAGARIIGKEINQLGPGKHSVWILSSPTIPGQSGSPVLSTTGEVVGLIYAMYRERSTDTVGVGLAVPLRPLRWFLGEPDGAPQ
jgi:S1-C subfamily serine protease